MVDRPVQFVSGAPHQEVEPMSPTTVSSPRARHGEAGVGEDGLPGRTTNAATGDSVILLLNVSPVCCR